jgi:hypothetical protein
MDVLIVAGSALLTVLVTAAIASVVAAARADGAERDLPQAPAPRAGRDPAPARRFRRAPRPRSSARR